MSQGLTLDDPGYFDRLDRADRDHWWPRAMWRIGSLWLDRALQGRVDLDAIDVGSGAGGTMERLANRPEIRSVVGIEPSRDAVALAHRRGLNIVRGDALRLPFASASFDVVTCLDVFQHLPRGGDLVGLQEIRRVLRPGGVVLIRTNGRGLWPDPASDAPLYTRSRLVRVVRHAGLSVDRATYVNALPAVASEVLGRFLGRSAHPSGGGLRMIARRKRLRDRGMGLVAGVESLAVGQWGLRLPVGHSTLVLARHPKGAAS